MLNYLHESMDDKYKRMRKYGVSEENVKQCMIHDGYDPEKQGQGRHRHDTGSGSGVDTSAITSTRTDADVNERGVGMFHSLIRNVRRMRENAWNTIVARLGRGGGSGVSGIGGDGRGSNDGIESVIESVGTNTKREDACSSFRVVEGTTARFEAPDLNTILNARKALRKMTTTATNDD